MKIFFLIIIMTTLAGNTYAGVLDKFKKNTVIQCGLLSSRIDGQDFTEDFLAQGLIKDEMSMTIDFKRKMVYGTYGMGKISIWNDDSIIGNETDSMFGNDGRKININRRMVINRKTGTFTINTKMTGGLNTTHVHKFICKAKNKF
tara:strand:- start:171 stop:605 length:435 start_codon:yes stop_codon:yes gene_type:complete